MTLAIAATLGMSGLGQEVDFARDVLPVLSDRCFSCHGPDESSRKAKLRLDTRSSALEERYGSAAIVPGNIEASELWLRVTSEFESDRMPPAESHIQALNADELGAIRTWIEAGAPWARHWAFVPPRDSLTAESRAPTAGHPIDAAIEARLKTRGLQLSQTASVRTLARRLSLDLTGLPPELDVVRALGDAPSDEDWARYTDALLSSPHYGERMAMWWLDGARYADSDGFQADDVRTNWPWRDWVVRSFQAGKPFDEFTLEQIAGDLLPNATDEQILATCFSRNHMHNGEGGRDPEESRIDYVRDRINTLGTVFLGLTLECAQCHDHKFDPVSQRDYYSLTAFFDSIDESGQAGRAAKPFLAVTPLNTGPHLALAERELTRARAAEKDVADSYAGGFEEWLQRQRLRPTPSDASECRGWSPLGIRTLRSTEGAELAEAGEGQVECRESESGQEDYEVGIHLGSLKRISGLRLEVFPDPEPAGGDAEAATWSFASDGEFIITGVKLRRTFGVDGAMEDVELSSAVANVVGKGVDPQYGSPNGVLDDDPRTGWTTRGQAVDDMAVLVLRLAEPLEPGPDDLLSVEILQRSMVAGAHPRRFRLTATELLGPILREVGPSPLEDLDRRSDAEGLPTELRDRLLAQFLENMEPWRARRAVTERYQAQLASAETAAGPVNVTVLRERETPRVTSILERGVWDQKGDVVDAAFPEEIFGSSADGNTALTRLDLARWITHPDHPLMARAIVNQLWQNLFGAGLVRTPADLGLQGEHPEYPEVLDWLAVEFIESGWNVRHVLRTIVSSRVYRQSSAGTVELLGRDPDNRWLARGARFRLPSWMIRDSALQISGLLRPLVAGPPMFPHQPKGVWEDVFNGRIRYEPTLGLARHRRTLYAFWRRNAAPTYLFDAADRRTCSVALRNTNTPLQALTLLNDASLVEAAIALALRATAVADGDPIRAIAGMAEAILQRSLEPAEIESARGVFDDVSDEFRGHTAQAVAFLDSVPLDFRARYGQPISSDAAEELAALAIVANMLFNLDEAVVHE